MITRATATSRGSRVSPGSASGRSSRPGVSASGLLLDLADLSYLGAFRMPPYYDSTDQFSYGGRAMAFNPANNSLFVAGKAGSVAEVSIPGTFSTSATMTDLSTGTLLQPFRAALSALPSPLTGADVIQDFGGLLVAGGKLYGSVAADYVAAESQTTSHFVFSSLDLSSATLAGLYAIGNGTPSARVLGGAMCSVPAAWQSALGHSALTGCSNLSRIELHSAGPAAIGFDPSSVGVSATATPCVYYPAGHSLANPAVGDGYSHLFNPIQSGTVTNTGMCFPEGTDTVLFFGKGAAQYVGYGTSDALNDANFFGYGPHAINGVYANRIWAYRASDFAAAKAGTVQPWNVLPYAAWDFATPITTPGKVLGNAAYDPATGRIYVAMVEADTVIPSSALPIIHVFSVTLPTSPRSIPPRIAFVAAWTSDEVPGPIPAGKATVLGAGLVFAQPGATIASVKFYLDADGNGTYSAGTDTLLGTATGDAQMPDGSSANYTLTISTAGFASGTKAIFAVATDSNGLTRVAAGTLTIA
jgi:hypothetical protein